MKEITLREAPIVALEIPAPAIARFRETKTAVNARTMIVWGEHCSECAFPSCYSNCDFYTPRSDLHCRRFLKGIEAVTIASAPALEGMTRIAFRQWGKLEGSGPAILLAAEAASYREKATVSFDNAFAKIPLPRPIGTRLVNRLNLRRRKTVRAASMPEDSVFIIEGWLEKAESISMTLSIMPWDKAAEGLFQQKFTFNQGYNREVIPTTAMRQSVSLDHPFAVQIEVVGEVPSQPVIFGLVDFATVSSQLASISGDTSPKLQTVKSKTAKCVVWDLDDTVWSGTLVEDGIKGVTLNPAAAEAIRLLDARGILNSVASKNDEELALDALKHFGLDDYILFPQIGWGPKSDAIRRIAESIDIGIDTLVFVDDQPFERGEVGAAHPTVTLMDPEAIANFSSHQLFNVPITEESKKRRLMYRDAEKRHKAAISSGTDYLAFLRSSGIELAVFPLNNESSERVYELTQRTNQLNVTGARFTREQILQFVNNNTTKKGYVMRCQDVFGDYGIIGFCILDSASFHIEAFFMSCRVQRKKVENAFMHWLSTHFADMGANSLTIDYRKTAKNGAAVKMFLELGFALEESVPGEGLFVRSLLEPWADSDVVRVDAQFEIQDVQ